MPSCPPRLTRPGLAIAVVLALGALAALVQPSPEALPARTGAVTSQTAAHTEAAGAMAPLHYAVFFRRASRSGRGAERWWAPGRMRWRT